jgi:hypothetical protein
LSGPETKQRASASSAPPASGPIATESKAKCAVGRSPQALMILSSMWIDPLVGEALSGFAWVFVEGGGGAVFATRSAVFGGGFGSSPQPARSAAVSPRAREASRGPRARRLVQVNADSWSLQVRLL